MIELDDLLRSAGESLSDRYEAGSPSLERLRPPAVDFPQRLVDIAYTVEDSPVGSLLLAKTDRGLVRVAYLDGMDVSASQRTGSVLADLAARVSPRVLESRAPLDPVRRELDEFFAGKRRHFDLKLDWRLTTGFARSVLKATAELAFAELTTYKRVATAVGSPRGYRAAGTALGSNPLPIVVPCHRVLHSGGGLGGYTGGVERKKTLLRIEGVKC